MQSASITSSAGGTSPRATSDRGIGSMRSEDFFKILVTELQNQDPLEPSKTSDMISNVSQIRNIELSTKLGTTLDSLVAQQRMADASGLIGKYVSGSSLDVGGVPVPAEGVVVALHYSADGVATLELDSGATMRLSDVASVTTTDHASDAAADAPASAKALQSRRRDPLSDIWNGVGRLLHLA